MVMDCIIFNMDITLAEIAASLGISRAAARARIKRANIKPIAYIGGGPMALYAPDIIEKIRVVRGRGRPKQNKNSLGVANLL